MSADRIELADVIDRIKEVVYGDLPDLEGYESLQQMWEVRRACETIAAAARKLRAEADSWLAEYLDGRSARMDDFLVRAKPTRKLIVMDPPTFWDFLGDDARECFRPEQVRITSLKAIAEKRGQDPRVVVDSLIDYERGDVALEAVPLSKAPKFASEMQHGQIKDRKPLL